MKRNVLWGAAALAACWFGQGRAAANEAVWSVAGKQVVRLRVTVGSMTPERRVEILDERMTNILSNGEGTLGAADIILQHDKGEVYITVRGELLVTVTQEDAAANRTTRDRLGRAWLVNLRKTLPQLAPRVNKGGA